MQKNNKHSDSVIKSEQLIESIIQCVIDYGVDTVCIGAGSRSTRLLEVISKLDLRVIPFFDERAVAFMALGVIKATKKPVMVVTTSGTAVSNCCPAVTEAFNDHLPLIICSADRPDRYYGTSANQTINQKKIFNSVVKEIQVSDTLSVSESKEMVNQLSIGLGDMVSRGGPVHINIQLRRSC